jgi:hypothetical protein
VESGRAAAVASGWESLRGMVVGPEAGIRSEARGGGRSAARQLLCPSSTASA